MKDVQLTAGTRRSRLALWQTDHVINTLERQWPGLSCRKQRFDTRGDKTLDVPLPQIGGKGLFTAELEQALRDGTIDFAVHSLKDLPTDPSPGLILGAITNRMNVQDVLVARVSCTLHSLPPGATVGTSSLRRAAQLLHVRSDLHIEPIRGNVETRVRKVQEGPYDATVMAAAGLERLGLEGHISEYMSLDLLLPAAGQGALAVQCRADDRETLAFLAAINDDNARRATTAERSFLSALGGGCSTPIGAFAQVNDDGHLDMRAIVASIDGEVMIRIQGTGTDAQELGQALAQEALERGAREVLADA
ncbi:MAG: hydroxymethylbilane synthase [Rhodothermales bacterium]